MVIFFRQKVLESVDLGHQHEYEKAQNLPGPTLTLNGLEERKERIRPN
jgi:hypothetical protein